MPHGLTLSEEALSSLVGLHQKGSLEELLAWKAQTKLSFLSEAFHLGKVFPCLYVKGYSTRPGALEEEDRRIMGKYVEVPHDR